MLLTKVKVDLKTISSSVVGFVRVERDDKPGQGTLRLSRVRKFERNPITAFYTKDKQRIVVPRREAVEAAIGLLMKV